MKNGTRSARFLGSFSSPSSTVFRIPPIHWFWILGITLALFLSSPATHAQSIKMSHIDGASYSKSSLDSAGNRTNWTIYGGIAGDLSTGACPDRTNSSTCNNCEDYGVPCNRRRIHPNLFLTFYYSSSQVSGRFLITNDEGEIALSDTDTQIINAGELSYARIQWGQLCDAIGSDLTCSTSASGSIRVGVDAATSSSGGSNEGAEDQRLNHSSDRYITVSVRVYAPTASGAYPYHEDCDDEAVSLCNFTVFPGDEKVFITRIKEGPIGFPATGGEISFRRVLFFCAKGTATADPTNGFADIKTAEVCGEMDIITDDDDDYAIDPDFIDELENDKYHYFRLAVEDEAGNIGYFTPASMDQTCLEDGKSDCHYAKPSEVLGALSEDVNCFISTAAYNSPLNEKVETFREFRNHFLLTNSFGSQLVDAYYQYGPKMARWMENHTWVKPVVRTLLWPVWAFARLSLTWGLIPALLGFIALFFTAFCILGRRSRKNPMNGDVPS